MPRIYDSCSDPIDFCKAHFPNEGKAFTVYGGIGFGPDGRGNCFEHNADHPDYQDEGYTCEVCGKELKSKDN